ncbi:hypothetical protein M1N50_03685 [Dehalococcoidia bacterium]|nr:hypothetical protein [Dehalococcoidia bacterium]
MSLSTFLFARVISVEAEIPAGVEIHPYDRVSEYVSMADYIAVSVCYCRHRGELLGRPCDKPKEVCLIFELREAMVSSLRQLPPSHRPAAGQ